jgi:Tol biopolymer transport system component
VEQLTRFGDYFSSSEIGSSSNWSPDGQKLAFWIDLSPSPCPGLRLAILDMTTKQVTNTCLPGTLQYAPPPIWSLDSRYILVMDATATPIKKILVDIENEQAFDITALVGDSSPIGWLASP